MMSTSLANVSSHFSRSLARFRNLTFFKELLNGVMHFKIGSKITCDVDFNSTNDFETRFLLPDATQITETEYNTKLAAGEQVYIACFVGCTYHCG